MENTKDIIVRELAERKQKSEGLLQLNDIHKKNGELTKRDIEEVIDKYITTPILWIDTNCSESQNYPNQ